MSVIEKFVSDGIVGDVIDKAPGKLLKISYPSGVVVEGVELTPTQVKDQPKVEWDAEDGAFYTLLMTGKFKDEFFMIIVQVKPSQIPMHLQERNRNSAKSVIG